MNDKIDIELPKLKKDVVIEIKDEDLSEVYDIDGLVNKKRKIFIISGIIFIFVCLYIFNFLKQENKIVFKENKVDVKNIEVIAYNKVNNTVDLLIEPTSPQERCSVSKDDNKDGLVFNTLSGGKCSVTVDMELSYLYFSDKNQQVSNKIELNDYVVEFNEKDKYYVALNSTKVIADDLLVVGNPSIKLVEDNGLLEIDGNNVKAIDIGNTILKLVQDNKIIKQINIIVTDTIVEVPKNFDEDKAFLGCHEFDENEAKLLDEILAYRIDEAGYGTRAGAVAAARFLTLEFPYRISYYWEAGRLNNTGKHYVDGEGRYYHKGLYLHESKEDDMVASLFGPAAWGCKIMSYEDDPPNFIPGKKYPNGLDCSGFVSWSLLNGGFDVGDRGAGELPSDGQMTDLGEFKKITNSMIKNGEIKVGDLFNFWGHIAILIGQDENNYYVAESLNNYKGVVVKTYSKKTVMKTFKYVVLMDDVYKSDGNLTDMWY